MTVNKSKIDKQKAFMRASVEMMEQAKEAVIDKYSKYEGTEEAMEHIVDLIETAKDTNLMTAKNAGYSQEDLKSAEYNKPNGMEVDKYRRHLEKIGITDEQMHNKAFAENELPTVVASSDSKKKGIKKLFSFSKNKNNEHVVKDEEDNTHVFDLSKRTVKGEGFTDDYSIESPEIVMKQISEEYEEQEEKTAVDNTNVNNSVLENYNKPLLVQNDSTPSVTDFDLTEISPMTRYDIIELPSHGECYPSKKGRLPVRELTAADENLIASPNMYVSGMLIDTLIRRCVLDKGFDTDKLCEGDRDAIVLWLRATAFGHEYAVTAKNPETGKEYKAKINLGDFKYKEFNLKGDENGWFDYTFTNGDVAKFKILSFKEIQEVQNDVAVQYVNQKKFLVYDMITKIRRQAEEIFLAEEGDAPLVDAIDYITEWANKSVVDSGYADKLYDEFVTKSMEKRTCSINGNTDRQFISDYIKSLRMSESRKYREYMFENIPGIDFSFEMPIPESDGGGSFPSFFRYDETIFLE